MSINSNSTNLKLDTARHSFAHLMASAVQMYFKQENNINQKLSKILKESLATGRQIFVDCLILNQGGEVFAQKRSGDRKKFPNCWDLPGGGLESGENIWECVKRELLEELQFELVEIIDVIDVLDFELPVEMRSETENYHQRVIQIVVKVVDYSKPVLEQGKAVDYKWINAGNQEILLEGRSNRDEVSNRYTFDTVQKGLDYKSKNIQFGVGPVIENGCYYDFILPRNLVPEDLKKIEKTIRELIKKDLQFEKKEWELSDAIEYFKTQNQPLKVELLENLRDNGTTNLSEEEKNDLYTPNPLKGESVPTITTYSIVDVKTGESIFSDLCKGPHVDDYTPNPLERGLSEKYDANTEAITELGRFPFNNNLVERAKKMLENPTIQESLVWNNILKSKLTGFKFTQQKIIDNYILDFYCSELLIAIELDGDQHLKANNLEYDKIRDNLLNSFGVKVIRISNDEASDIELLTKQIKNIIDQRKNELSGGKPPFKGVGGIVSGGVTPLSNIGFSLDKFSASYWRGDQERGINMQRLYALVFETNEELDKFKNDREEAKKRDHRVLNQTQKYYTISDLVGAGLTLFQPNGMIIRQNIQDYLWQLHKNKGYKRVWTPHIAKIALYETSGHAAKFGDELFKVKGKTDDFIMKPMNCPHHMQIFADNQFSYRDMPVRYFEPATVYRDEKPGQLSGFTRVRCITQDDGHLFCRTNQIQEEVSVIVNVIREFYQTVDMQASWVSLSVRDNSDNYLGSDEMWNTAEKALEEVAISNNLNYTRVEGEAAFYGPKLDFMFKDCLGREWQLATIQCDFNLPERFDLSFTNESGEKERPVVIHRAISGSLERFMGVIIDHYAGKFPFWLAPEQIRILTINDQVLDHVNKITDILNDSLLMKPLKYNEIRHSVDKRSESLGKKIREAKNDKIPMLMVVGLQDVENNQVSIEYNGESVKVGLDELKVWIGNIG